MKITLWRFGFVLLLITTLGTVTACSLGPNQESIFPSETLKSTIADSAFSDAVFLPVNAAILPFIVEPNLRRVYQDLLVKTTTDKNGDEQTKEYRNIWQNFDFSGYPFVLMDNFIEKTMAVPLFSSLVELGPQEAATPVAELFSKQEDLDLVLAGRLDTETNSLTLTAHTRQGKTWEKSFTEPELAKSFSAMLSEFVQSSELRKALAGIAREKKDPAVIRLPVKECVIKALFQADKHWDRVYTQASSPLAAIIMAGVVTAADAAEGERENIPQVKMQLAIDGTLIHESIKGSHKKDSDKILEYTLTRKVALRPGFHRLSLFRPQMPLKSSSVGASDEEDDTDEEEDEQDEELAKPELPPGPPPLNFVLYEFNLNENDPPPILLLKPVYPAGWFINGVETWTVERQ